MEQEIQIETQLKSLNQSTEKGFIKCRIDIENSVYERYLEVKKVLKSRRLENFGLSKYINELLKQLSASSDLELIKKFTPLEFKIKNLLECDENRKKLEKLISKL
jgi:hypothetical protein